MQNKSSFFIVGKHAVIEALKNSKRKVLRVFLTEESKKTIHKISPKINLLKDKKLYFKTKQNYILITTRSCIPFITLSQNAWWNKMSWEHWQNMF